MPLTELASKKSYVIIYALYPLPAASWTSLLRETGSHALKMRELLLAYALLDCMTQFPLSPLLLPTLGYRVRN